jgi:hypothetical protein
MTTVKKIIDWDGCDEGPVLRELHNLPPGRYVITPLDETWNLTDEEEADLERALDEADRDEFVDADEVHRGIRARIDAAMAPR